jgi:hypothetical protein
MTVETAWWTTASFAREAERLDRAAANCVARAAGQGIAIRLATNDAERRAALRLRYEAVIRHGWERPEAFPDGLESEPDDDDAVHLLAWVGERPVGNSRIVLPRPGRPLPLEIEYGLRVEPLGKVVQLDRVCVDREASHGAPIVLIAMLSGAWAELRRQGYAICAGLNTASMLRIYRRVGIDPQILGSAQVSWNEMRYPVLFSPLQILPVYYERYGEKE